MAANRQQYVRSHGFAWTVGAVDADLYPLVVRRKADAFGAGPDMYPLTFENVPDCFGNVLIFPGYQACGLLDDGHVCTQPAVYLRELEADVAAADHDQMRRQTVEREDGGISQIRHVPDARHVGHQGPPPDIDEDAWRRQPFLSHTDAVRRLEFG